MKVALPDEFHASGPVLGLTYVSDAIPGIARWRRGRGFGYARADGRPVSAEERARIAHLGIPPAWRDVWICADPAGHIQATGVDAAGRKQYRYHADWSAWRSKVKYDTLASFGAALARFRARVARDLEGRAGDLDFSLAAMAVLLDRLNIRVGSAAHTAASRTYGASTLLRRHLRLDDGLLTLRFKAKGGREVTHRLRDTRLHRIFEAIDDLPGRRLFTWIDAEGAVHPVNSQHMNAYLQESTGLREVSAKTFRTWAGTLAAFDAARAEPGRLTIRALSEAASARLRNTPAIARSSYIHTAILDLAEMEATARLSLLRDVAPAGPSRLRANERRLLGFLQQAANSGEPGPQARAHASDRAAERVGDP